MPCPYFEPLQPASDPQYPWARLPLLEEYDGLCRALAEPIPVPSANRFRCCNHGYSKGCCSFFPHHELRSCSRYDVVLRTEDMLELVCLEEKDHTPSSWHVARFFHATGRIEPEIEDRCKRSQILAFCRSYLSRFPQ
jgi:hypothetical protein